MKLFHEVDLKVRFHCETAPFLNTVVTYINHIKTLDAIAEAVNGVLPGWYPARKIKLKFLDMVLQESSTPQSFYFLTIKGVYKVTITLTI